VHPEIPHWFKHLSIGTGQLFKLLAGPRVRVFSKLAFR
jgi:hypothetical protein